MEKRLTPGDPVLIEDIVTYLKAKGIFDEFRHECLADVDTKSSCQNLSQRVDGYTTKFLSGETWNPNLNKNELRNKLRRHIDESGMLAGGADHVVEQVINPKINQLFLPRIIEVVHQYLNEENEKINKNKERKNDNVNFEKPSTENIDGTYKTKPAKLDPIADILSFSYSKPKTTPLQNVQTKVTDSTKIERKKDESMQQTKILEVLPKVEKKKEEAINPVKASEIVSKAKKEETISDGIQSAEKDMEECISIKTESIESPTELQSAVPAIQTKSQNDSKEPIKIKKEIKTDESESVTDTIKKLPKEDIKLEKRKGELEKKDDLEKKKDDSEKKKDDSEKKKDDSKPGSDLSSNSEEASQSKVVPFVPKSSSDVKNKSDPDKSKKVKSHSSSKTSSETQKSKSKDSFKVSSKSSEKHKTVSKVSKSVTKDHSSPHKNSGKSSKSDKTDDNYKNKSKDGNPKSSDNSALKPTSSKPTSIKKESSSMNLKPSSDKAKISNSFNVKPNIKSETDSSEKSTKSSFQSSSYDSSQGSDQDKSSTSSSQHKEKNKLFSKHHKKENNKKSSERAEKTPEKKRFQSDSDSGTPVKHKHMKHISEKEKKKSLNIQESAKISSRSNSFGSTSSVSDSPSSSSKETSASASEETSDNSLKSSESKKKQDINEKERCKRTDDFPPPPPPPPTSGISAQGSSSAEISSMDETQSSQDSESDSKISEDDESSSESDVENLYSSNTLKNSNLPSPKLKTPEILNDIFDVFLYSSSSSEFEGYSSTPEEKQTDIKQVTDVYVSSVHTSDLSSYDDFLSESEFSNSDIDEDRPTRRLTIKEAEKLLEEKARQRRLERSKNMLASKGSLDDKKSSSSPQILTSTLLSEEESSPAPEPKRESRRERKLNPKYASSEYTSIFNSKKTSFITKQLSPNENKSENISPAMSETDIQHPKAISPPKRRISMGNLEANQLPDENVKKSLCAAATLQTLELSDMTKRKLSFESTEESSWNSESKTYLNSHERNHNSTLENTDSHIALKIKKSVIKNDNAVNKDPRPQGLKRKLARNEKEDAKKLCRRNSDNSSSSESVPNENNPFNIKATNPSSVFNMEIKDKDFFRKQNININRVVLKMEHVKKKSHSKPNHVIETQSND